MAARPRHVHLPPEEDVLAFLDQVVGRLERLGDRLEMYATTQTGAPQPGLCEEGPDVSPPSA